MKRTVAGPNNSVSFATISNHGSGLFTNVLIKLALSSIPKTFAEPQTIARKNKFSEFESATGDYRRYSEHRSTKSLPNFDNIEPVQCAVCTYEVAQRSIRPRMYHI